MESLVLIFGASLSQQSPRDYLRGFANTMSRESLSEHEFFECTLGNLKAVRIGDYSNEFTTILWCAATEHALVHVGLLGSPNPSGELRSEVEQLLSTLSADADTH
jgi:hypothetical protein